MHRIFAVVLALSMFHLFLVAADLVCSSHEAAVMSAMSMGDGHEMATTAAAESTSSHRTDHGSAPDQARCCDAMSSCGVSAIGATERDAAIDSFSERTPTTAVVLIASAVPAPEPPPPKA